MQRCHREKRVKFFGHDGFKFESPGTTAYPLQRTGHVGLGQNQETRDLSGCRAPGTRPIARRASNMSDCTKARCPSGAPPNRWRFRSLAGSPLVTTSSRLIRRKMSTGSLQFQERRVTFRNSRKIKIFISFCQSIGASHRHGLAFAPERFRSLAVARTLGGNSRRPTNMLTSSDLPDLRRCPAPRPEQAGKGAVADAGHSRAPRLGHRVAVQRDVSGDQRPYRRPIRLSCPTIRSQPPSPQKDRCRSLAAIPLRRAVPGACHFGRHILGLWLDFGLGHFLRFDRTCRRARLCAPCAAQTRARRYSRRHRPWACRRE